MNDGDGNTAVAGRHECLVGRLRSAAVGRTEWRVQDPETKAYCISFDYIDSINPERAANAWLSDHKTRFPTSGYAQYEVARVVVLDERDRLLLEAADALELALNGVALSDLLSAREVELVHGMIEVQLNHAERCDRIINRHMAEQQRGWDMERVELLRKVLRVLGR